MNLEYQQYSLNFKFEAGTSRGVLTEKKTWFIAVSDAGNGKGIGECGPLRGLSIDDRPDFEEYLGRLAFGLKDVKIPTKIDEVFDFVEGKVSREFPSIRFGLETALLDYINGGERVIFKNDFAEGNKSIPINGLIWMGKKDFMLEQIQKKIGEGYRCLKMKIGAIDFRQECELLKFVRSNFPKKDLTLRVDANGAFTEEDAEEKLKILSKFDVHSIEQPVRQGQRALMVDLVKKATLPIALDEELIGVQRLDEKESLLDEIKPPYIILKPTLLGGIRSCKEWISLAEERNIGWWITSALESNIGLNAIAQFTAEYDTQIPQGLGTGQLYWNNINSPLAIDKGYLKYGKNEWGNIELL